MLTGLWNLKDFQNTRQNRSKNKLVRENAVTRQWKLFAPPYGLLEQYILSYSKPRALSFSLYIISGLVMTQRYLCCLGASSPEGVGVGTFAGSQANTSGEERAETIKGKGKD